MMIRFPSRPGDGTPAAAMTAYVRDATGEQIGELLLWVEDVRLSAIEYVWFTDEPPSGLPKTLLVHVQARPTR